MIKLDVKLPKSPLFGFPLQRSGESEVVPFSATVSSGEPVRIGAIRAAWQVTVQLPLAGRSVQECWTWGERTPSETILTEVCSEVAEVKPGHPFQTDFTLSLPCSLPPSTDNSFEKVVHTLYVSAYPPAPEYQDVVGYATAAAESSKSGKWKGLGGILGSKKKETPQSKSRAKSANDPLAEAFGPAIASFSCDIKYITPLHDRGVSRLFEINKVAPVEDLGVVRAVLLSRVMVAGSSFFVCLRVDSIQPETTISTAQIRLQQRSASPDESEVQFDDWVIYKWFEPPGEDGRSAPLFPGPSAVKPKSDVYPPRAGADFLHLSALPRLPSPACGVRDTTIANTKLSSTRHTLIIEIKFYTPADFVAAGSSFDGGDLPEDKHRTMVLRFDVLLGDCTMTYTALQVPRYSVNVLPRGDYHQPRLDPYPDGQEPIPCRLTRVSWIVRDGKSLERRKIRCSASKIRNHQLETGTICMCFFEVSTALPPPGGSWTDHVEPYTGPSADDAMEAEIRQIEKDYVARSGRKHVPGFLHILLDECLCQSDRTATGEARLGAKAIAASAADPPSSTSTQSDDHSSM